MSTEALKDFDIGGGMDTPDLDTSIAQVDDNEIEISFVDEPQTPEPVRRAQNDPVETDPIETERQQWSQRDADREADFAAREERYGRALADAEKRRVSTERESASVALDGVDLRIRTAVEAIKAAKAESDYSAEVDFAQQLNDLRQVRQQIVQMQSQLPSEQVIDQQFDAWKRENASQRRPTTPANAGAVPGNPLATEYMAKNGWMSNPAHTQARDYLLKVDQQLASEGFDPKSPSHFEEMSRRVAARFPTVGVKMLDGRAVGTSAPLAASRPTSPPVASARMTAAPVPGQPQRRNTVTLNDFDRKMMRSMGLDPGDKRVQQRFAREKMARERTEMR